jgi:hypothetical protein
MTPKQKQNQETLALQNAAMRAYAEHHGETWEDIARESQLPKGDTLALFLWHEIGEAGGDANEAARMLMTIKGEITAVWQVILACAPFDDSLPPVSRLSLKFPQECPKPPGL